MTSAPASGSGLPADDACEALPRRRELHPLWRAIAVRLGVGAMTLFAVSVIIFSAMEMLPGDFATAVLGQFATPETVAAFHKDLGLDRPAVVRYLTWIGGALQGDFGSSFSSQLTSSRTVSSIVLPRLQNTLLLASITALIAVPTALVLGLLAALYRNSFFDRAINVVSIAAVSMPEFFVAYILVLLFAVRLQWLPSMANLNVDMELAQMASRMILPVLTLTLATIAHMMRTTRTAVIALLSQRFIEMAEIKGIAPWRIIVRHALPNAWAPIANVIIFNLAYLVVGVVVVEVVFVYPGIGQAMVDAVRAQDIPVVQACALVFAGTYISFNLLADIISIVTNPRLLHPK